MFFKGQKNREEEEETGEVCMLKRVSMVRFHSEAIP